MFPKVAQNAQNEISKQNYLFPGLHPLRTAYPLRERVETGGNRFVPTVINNKIVNKNSEAAPGLGFVIQFFPHHHHHHR